MKVFTVIVTEITREVWYKDIVASSMEEAEEIAWELERPWNENPEETEWIFNMFRSGLDEVRIDVVNK